MLLVLGQAAGCRGFPSVAAVLSRAVQLHCGTSSTSQQAAALFGTSSASPVAAAASPANAMQLIKELRQQSGAPISDVKVKIPII